MNSQENWDLQIDSSVLKYFKNIPRKDAESLRYAIGLLPDNPYSGDIQKIKGEENTWRRRIGTYRIFFDIFVNEKAIIVFHAERRNSNTY